MTRKAAVEPPLPPAEPHRPTGSGLVTVAVMLMTIAALYLGQDIFVPFALAVLLSFMLAPVVGYLRKLRLPHIPSVLLAVASALVVIGALSVLVGTQIVHLAENLPDYQYTMQEKVRAVRKAMAEGGIIKRTSAVIEAVTEELSSEAAEPEENEPFAASAPKDEPVTVRVEPPRSEPLDALKSVLGPLIEPIGAAGITIVFTIFILLEHNDMRDRFIRLVGGNLRRTTEALNEAASRVGRYLFMQLVVNASYGIPVGIGLYFIGVPGAFLWGLLATLLRFVPYLGPFIAAIFPVVLAFAVDPGWTSLLWTLALILTMELISNNVVEPVLYGSSTGLSPVAVILAAIFWTLLWGPIGLILSTPLTVCLVVIGRYVPQLAFLGVLLSKEPALQPEERLYQRLLAGNIEEAIDIAEEEVAETSLLDFYENVCIPALCLAERDRHLGATTSDRKRIAEGMNQIVSDLREQEEKLSPDQEGKNTADNVSEQRSAKVLCIAGRWELDAASAAVLAHSLESRSMNAEHVPALTISMETIGSLDLEGVEILCLTYYDPAPHPYARFVCRRLKRRMPDLKIALGLWNLDPAAGKPEDLAKTAGADFAASSLGELVSYVDGAITRSGAPPISAPPVPADEEQRLEALYASGLLHASASEKLDQVTRKVADAFEMPIVLVSLINETSQIWKGATGLEGKAAQERHALRDSSICTHVVASDAPLVVRDTARDRRFSGNPFVLEQGIRFYGGVPLRTASGHVVGTLCMIDKKPRSLTSRDIKLLQLIADELMADVKAHPPATDASGSPRLASPLQAQ
jgi:predicted PurR-regulated permease PerM